MRGYSGSRTDVRFAVFSLVAIGFLVADTGWAGSQQASEAPADPAAAASPQRDAPDPMIGPGDKAETAEPDWYKKLTEDEKKQLQREEAGRMACKIRVCRVLMDAPLAGPIAAQAPGTEPISCTVAKTYLEPQLKAFFKPRRFNWTYGHARCAAQITVDRALMHKAMRKGQFVARPEPHTVTCELKRRNEKTEGYKVLEVKITAQPTVTFRDGRADKITLGIQKTEAPWLIRGAVWAIARLEANFDMFEGAATERINHFTKTECAELLRDETVDKAAASPADLPVGVSSRSDAAEAIAR